MKNELALPLNADDLIAEYNEKIDNITQTIAAYEKAYKDLQANSTVNGRFGGYVAKQSFVYRRNIEKSLKVSIWQEFYSRLQIDKIASADDRKKWELAMENPTEPTKDNIKATFADYLIDPRHHILRGLAEAFVQLDSAYKSHDRVKIGVKGLPKKVILTRWDTYGHTYQRFKDIINALQAYRNRPALSSDDMTGVRNLHHGHDLVMNKQGIKLRLFKNRNLHIIFDKCALLDINKAMAEYYGDVLPDAYERGVKPSTEVAKDLQFYRTPDSVADKLVSQISFAKNSKILEPSCGDGSILDALVRGGWINAIGIECHPIRANAARAKGHSVVTGNFLEQPPEQKFDAVVMNPPFYGKHYAKHILHAIKFLNKGGVLYAILPATARYDHKLLPETHCNWCDLPVGSFSKSGTNIATTIYSYRKVN